LNRKADLQRPNRVTDYSQQETVAPEMGVPELTQNADEISQPGRLSKEQIRVSLRASTWDGVFATLFSSITGGVLINNFLVELNASALQIGLLASIPMIANLLQPLGAYLADRSTSRRRYNLWVYSISRLLWLPLAIAILVYPGQAHRQTLIFATLAVMLATHLIGALGSASWLAWIATLIPRQVRGRYFGFRNSAFSFTGLVSLPLLGVIVSHWMGGSLQGFGIMLVVAVVAGLVSLTFQARMADVNPQAVQFSEPEREHTILPDLSLTQEPELKSQLIASVAELPEPAQPPSSDQMRFLLFLLYFGLWAFGINLSNPFFNLYLLDDLALDLNWVTVYNSLGAAANLLMMLRWGRLADRIGNRSILLLDGILVAIVPLLWLGTSTSPVSLWLWFPLLHLLGGGTGAAIDLCINNLQFAIVPIQNQTKYFALTAAVGGVAGALGSLAGGWLAQSASTGHIPGLFALSSILRLVALLPLVWVQEPLRPMLRNTLQTWYAQLQKRWQPEATVTTLS
jgi:MFS family permease